MNRHLRKVIILSFLIYSQAFPQYVYPLAREVWSKPEKLFPDSLYIRPNFFSTTETCDTIIYCDQNIYYIYRDSTGNWVSPRMFNPAYGLPNLSPAYAVLTPDKKTLYFTDKWSTRMYRARYNDSTGEWGPKETFFDNGFNQTPRWYCMNFSNDTTMLVVGNEFLRKAKLRDGLWYPDDGFPEPGASWLFHNGVWLNAENDRLYSGDQVGWSNVDLHVTFFYDSVISQVTYKLNISQISDSLFLKGEYMRRNEHHPFLSADRKKMIFTADYDGQLRYYTSRLLIDENGDTVLTSLNEREETRIKTGNRILPNNPNPFSGETSVNFYLEKASLITLKVYNSLGSEILRSEDEHYGAGINSKRISNLPTSGVYIIALQGSDIFLTNKITYIK